MRGDRQRSDGLLVGWIRIRYLLCRRRWVRLCRCGRSLDSDPREARSVAPCLRCQLDITSEVSPMDSCEAGEVSTRFRSCGGMGRNWADLTVAWLTVFVSLLVPACTTRKVREVGRVQFPPSACVDSALVRHLPQMPLGYSAKPGLVEDVSIRLIVDENGKVVSSTVLETPNLQLALSTQSAASRWTFRPVTVRSQAVQFECSLMFRFRSGGIVKILRSSTPTEE